MGQEVLCRFKWCISCGKCHMGCCIKYFCMDKDSYAYMVVPGGSFSGDLSEYTMIGLTVANIENVFRVDILANGKTFTGKGINANGKIVLNILQDFNKQWEATKIT